MLLSHVLLHLTSGCEQEICVTGSGYIPHYKNHSICLQLEVKAGQVRHKDGIDGSYFLWDLRTLSVFSKSMAFMNY